MSCTRVAAWIFPVTNRLYMSCNSVFFDYTWIAHELQLKYFQ
jgi:hypothetical protein